MARDLESSRTRRSRRERRQQIAEAALHILASRGVRSLTSAALAEEVGISDGAIFRHFRDLNEVVVAAIDVFEAAFEETFPPSAADDGEGARASDPLEQLGSFLQKRIALVRKQPDLLRLAFNDRLAEAAGPLGAVRVKSMVDRSLTFIHRCLSDAQAAGSIDPGVPPALLVWMIVGVVQGAATRRRAPRMRGATFASASTAVIWQALRRSLLHTGQRNAKGDQRA